MSTLKIITVEQDFFYDFTNLSDNVLQLVAKLVEERTWGKKMRNKT